MVLIGDGGGGHRGNGDGGCCGGVRHGVRDGDIRGDSPEHDASCGVTSHNGDVLERRNDHGRQGGVCCDKGNSNCCVTSGRSIRHGSRGRVSSRGNGRVTGGSNAVRLLHSRELGLAPATGWFVSGNLFANKQNMNLYSGKEELRGYDSFLKSKNKEIDEIIAIKDIVIMRSRGGLTGAFSAVTHKLLCYLNQGRSENIEMVFHNQYRDSLMIVSTDQEDGFTSRNCRELYIGSIWKKKLNAASIFGDEDFKWPGFISFDKLNEIVLIKTTEAYRTFDLQTYSFQHEFSASNVKEVLSSPQVLIVRFKSPSGQLHLEFRSVENGETLSNFKCRIGEGSFTFLGIINEKLLIKQRLMALQVVDLQSLGQQAVEIGEFVLHPLYRSNTFLSFRQRSTEVRASNGELVRSFENHVLANTFEEKICTSWEQDMVLSTCTTEGNSAHSIKASSIDSGKLLFTIQPSVRITSLCFNNELKEVYAGTESGLVQVWSV